MPSKSIFHSTLNVLLLVSVCLGTIATAQGLMLAAEPHPSPSPTPDSTAIAVIDSIVVNGVKAESASNSDIELSRSGAAAPEPSVNVGSELKAGDKIKTRDQDQVVLRLPVSGAETDDFVYLDPNSEVAIGSVCAVAGRILSWAGVRFRLCTSWGTLGVSGTQFEVNIMPPDGLTVVVYEGEVKLEPQSDLKLDRAKIISEKAARASVEVQAETKTASPSKGLKIKSDGTTEPVNVSRDLRIEGVDYWSVQMIRASQNPAGVSKGFVNYSEDKRAEEFKTARREALVSDSPSGYLAMAQALNDWDEGAAAKKSLSKVKVTSLQESPEFMVNAAEADRLQGNLTQANVQLDKAILKHPDYSPAYYLKAKVIEAKISSDPEHRATDKAEMRRNLTKALFYDSGKGQINTRLVSAELEETLRTFGSESLVKEPWLSSGYEWFDIKRTRDLVKYFGNARVNVGGRSASGNAELSVSGDQFKLKVADQLFTGRIVGNRNIGGVSFAMQFDDVGAIGTTQEDVVVSIRGTKPDRGLVLASAPQQAATFVFSSKAGGPQN